MEKLAYEPPQITTYTETELLAALGPALADGPVSSH